MKNIKDIIQEKLILNKNISSTKDNIYWFTNNFGVKIPFDLKCSGRIALTITISKIVQIDNDKWELYDNNNNHILSINKFYRDLLFLKEKRTIITDIFYDDIKNALHRQGKIVVRYTDKEDKIITESQEEPKKYVNMILLDHDEESVLIMRRANYMKNFKSLWGFPGGALDKKDKDSKAGAIRELKEETGIELTFNEERWCKKFDTITNKDGSISEYYITHFELEKLPEIKLSKEHSKYEWFNEKSDANYRWMPDVFQIIQKIL